MPFPQVQNSFETFFEPTRVWLFGKPFPTIAYVPTTMEGVNGPGSGGPDGTHANEFMTYPAPAQNQQLPIPPRRLERKLRRAPQIFARIYSFSFEGHYYKLPRPLLFLVGNDGVRADEARAADSNGQPAFHTKLVGIESKDWQFSEDIQVWAVDKMDVAICLDLEVGPYQQVLLDSMVAYEDDLATRGSAVARGSAVTRGSAVARGSATFRGSMVGPHQNR